MESGADKSKIVIFLCRRRCTNRCPATRGYDAITRLHWLNLRRPAGDCCDCNKHNISCLGHRQEMEKHKQLLDKEYEQLLTQFSKVIIQYISSTCSP